MGDIEDIVRFLGENALEQIFADMSCQLCNGHPDICEEEGGRCKVSPHCFTLIQIQAQMKTQMKSQMKIQLHMQKKIKV